MSLGENMLLIDGQFGFLESFDLMNRSDHLSSNTSKPIQKGDT